MTERLQFDLFANDRASAGFAAAGRSAQAAADDVMGLARRLDEVDHKSADARVGLTGNKEALLDLDRLDDKLRITGRKVTPDISLDGFAKAMLDVSTLDVALDKLGKKSVTPSIGGIGGAASGAAGAAGGAAEGGGGVLSAAGGPLSNPYVLTGAVAAGLASLPFIAQAAAAGIVSAIGGGFAAIAIYGASKIKEVRQDFAFLATSAESALAAISKPFKTVLLSVEGTAQEVLESLVGPMAAAIKTIAGPFTLFADKLLQAFGQPAVAKSIQAVATAFGAILKALAPGLAGGIAGIAAGITNISKSVAANPRAFADFIGDLFKIAGVSLDVIAALTKAATAFENFMHSNSAVAQVIKAVWDGIDRTIKTAADLVVGVVKIAGDLLAGNWSAANSAAEATARQVWASIRAQLVTDWDLIRSRADTIFGAIRHDIAAAWNVIWSDTTARVQRGIADVVAWFAGLPHRAVGALSGLGNQLGNFAFQAIELLLDGLKRGATDVLGWIQHFASGIVGIFKKVWGWFSPSSVMYEGGQALMEGLAKGIQDHAHKAKAAAAAAASATVPNVGSGVTRWTGVVQQALRMEGLSEGLTRQVLYQMQTESGGNPNAINLTDINAQMGDPSRGLLQTIMATFQAYHWPGTSANIYDPLANVAAAINYARHVYGPNLMSNGSGLGSGHGYDSGGLLPPGLSLALNTTGRAEVVAPGGMGRVEALLDEINDRLAQLTAVAAAAPATTGATLGAALAGGARSATYRALYS